MIKLTSSELLTTYAILLHEIVQINKKVILKPYLETRITEIKEILKKLDSEIEKRSRNGEY